MQVDKVFEAIGKKQVIRILGDVAPLRPPGATVAMIRRLEGNRSVFYTLDERPDLPNFVLDIPADGQAVLLGVSPKNTLTLVSEDVQLILQWGRYIPTN